MGSFRDLTGQKFGRLEPLRYNRGSRTTMGMWVCRCDCGNIKDVVPRSLLIGDTKSCGCLAREVTAVDLSGMVFGKLVALEPTEKRGHGGSVIWRCKCDCGNESLVSANKLKWSGSISCGCSGRPDLRGLRVGRLKVLSLQESNRKERYWNCVCDCGRVSVVRTVALTSGRVRSCGCLMAAHRIIAFRKGSLDMWDIPLGLARAALENGKLKKAIKQATG